MHFHKTEIAGCFIIEPEVFEDERGGFFRTFCENEFKEHIGSINFTQINHSINYKKGTFRGMHYQNAPYCEGKLIRCISGKVVDYFIDLRKGSPTFLKYSVIELSAENKKMIYLCEGIAHGFFTLDNNSELIYHHTTSYQKSAECGIRYNDPMVNIKLPNEISVISYKDRNYPLLTTNFLGIEI